MAVELNSVFSRDVAAVFRHRIRWALAEQGFSDDDVLSSGDEMPFQVSVPMVIVNETFPWEQALYMFPCVLAALPTLPAGLEYRFVATSLVLVDVDANLTVDVLPDALRASLITWAAHPAGVASRGGYCAGT